jgi:Ni/Co efflux regulator RcnB
MKKLMTLLLLLSSLAFVPSTRAANIKSGAAFNTPQLRIQIGRRRHRRDWERQRDWAYGDRVGYGRVFTRDVRVGFRTYRETYQVVDGRTVLVSRVRLY